METATASALRVPYRTSDLYFAAYLSALELPLQGVESEQTEGSKKVFVFMLPKSDINRLKAAYFGGTATVKALAFVNAVRSLKSLCFT